MLASVSEDSGGGSQLPAHPCIVEGGGHTGMIGVPLISGCTAEKTSVEGRERVRPSFVFVEPKP